MVKDNITVIETNIDDLLPLSYESLFEKLLKKGALDVCIIPVQMKKTRPGVLLTVLSKNELVEKIISVIFKETSTFGIRYYQVTRYKLKRKIKSVKTRYGTIRVKIGYLGNKVNTISPEYEDCKRLADKFKISLRRVYEEAKFVCAGR
ncbi:MAG: nickel insertion protein [Candidatus Omnitrophota bacterium]|nr:nickel insertion protein [Candidatus Omnitrophota bacterium]